MRTLFFTAALVVVLTAPAFASVDRKVMQIQAIRAQQAEIRAGVESSSGAYKELSADARSTLLGKQDQLLRLIEGKHSTDDLNEDQKTEVFNTLEWIEATVKNADDERIVCERRPILGSTRKARVCKTVAQMRTDRERAREEMDNSQNKNR